MNVPERYRLALVAATSLIVVVIVAGTILLLNRPGPTPVESPTPTAVVSPSLDPTTPEGAVRSFFDAFAKARRSDDPALIRPYVTVRLVYTEGGYDISLDSGTPLESPNALAPRNVTMELRNVDRRWLVDTYEARSQ